MWKKISLKESTYKRLSSLKKENESFSDVVERITKGKTAKYSDLAGIVSEKTIKAIENIRKERKSIEKNQFKISADEL